jgi:hypothetical protein
VKTQVINLESYDDRHSILDKLKWGQADRVILLFPLRGMPLSNKLDLKIIHRHCQTNETKLAMVTKNQQIKDFAYELNIPVFRSLRQAQKIAWEYMVREEEPAARPEKKFTRQELAEKIQHHRTPGWAQQKSVRITAFVLSILALLVLAAFLVPGAQIEYLPEFETQSLTLTLTASPAFSGFNLSGAVPARMESISVEGRSSLAPSGEMSIPAQNATGLIEITNLTDQPITIPAGTIIRTADPTSTIRFRTSTEVTLEALSGAKISIPIEAENPGENSNLPAETLVLAEGELSRSLTVTNPEPTTGGTTTTTTAPTAEDYDQLSGELLDALWLTALEEAQTVLDENDIILDDQPQSTTIIEETFSPPEPQPSAALDLLLRVEYEILTIRWEDLKDMGNAILDATLPDGYAAQAETLTIQNITPPVLGEDGQITWEAAIERQIFTTRQEAQAVHEIRGQTLNNAAENFQNALSLQQEPKIVVFPDWWPLVPFLDFRIQTIDILQDAE